MHIRYPQIDDSLRLQGNQPRFSTMDLASGYWQVVMSLDAKRKADDDIRTYVYSGSDGALQAVDWSRLTRLL